jgi:hypothetical protein
MKFYRCLGLAEVYSDMIKHISSNGALTNPRGLPCRELRPVIIESHSPGECMIPDPSVNYRFAMAEYMAMRCGWNDLSWPARFNKNVAQFAEADGTFHGAYGTRLGFPSKYDAIIEKLSVDPDTRQAVLTLWNNDLDVLQYAKKDHPCNTQIYFKVRKGELDLTVFRRSADVIWGVPYDHFVFGTLLCHMAEDLDVRPGVLREYIDSLHMYSPEAGFYDADRVEEAAATLHTAIPIPEYMNQPDRSYTQVRDAIMTGAGTGPLSSYGRMLHNFLLRKPLT